MTVFGMRSRLRRVAGGRSSVVDPNLDRAALTARAGEVPEKESVAIARHLARLRNFRAASDVILKTDLERLSLLDQCFAGTTLLQSHYGLVSDELLVERLETLGAQTLQPAEAVRLAEWVQLSGLPVEEKLNVLDKMRINRTNSDAAASAQRDLRFRAFRLRADALEDVDVLAFFEGEDEDPLQKKDNLRYVTALVTHGHADTARVLVETQLTRHGLADRAVLEAAMRFDSGSLLGDLSAVPAAHRAAPGVLALAHDLRSRGESYEALFQSCRNAAAAAFPSANVYQKDTLLRVLTVKDLLPESDSLVPDLRGVPDTVLGARCGRGLIAMEKGANQDSADLLRSVLREDPAFTAAATGLRFVLARLDNDEDVIGLRNEVGYGAASAGRAGVRTGDRDQATSLLLTGDYLKSWRVRRTAPQWRILKRELGSRFLNYEELPEKPGSSLFLIADDGVGDEIRGAQYLGALSERFDVTATCDPRLRTLLERSFPTIRFVDVPRRIRGTLNPIYDGRYSDFILASHLPAHCDPYVQAADYVTFGQNLTFNRFAGVLPRLDTGAYLIPDPTRVAPRSQEKLKVGLVWKSHLASASRKMMYLGVEQLTPLLDVPSVEFWSVQHSSNAKEAAFCEEHGIRQIENVDLFDDFEGLAGHLSSMDLVIGISTVPMELAAAVGTPTWLLGFSPENYYYRTAGGETEIDQLSRNSTVIAPRWIDFSSSYDECVEQVMVECRKRLERFTHDRVDGIK